MEFTELGLLFGIVRRRSQAIVSDACKEMDLIYSEYAMLLRLCSMEGCSQDEMAASLCVDKAAVTRVIKSLETKGFLYRKHDSFDHRQKRLYFTEKGLAAKPKLKNIVETIMGYLAEGFTDEQISVMSNGFKQLSDKLCKATYEDVYGGGEK